MVGGYVYPDDVNTAEIVDIEDPNGGCEFPPYPIADTGMTMAFVDGVLKSCGGDETSNCYDFDPQSQTWTQSGQISLERYPAHSSIIDNKWLISGDSVTTDGWNGNQFESGPLLPELIDDTCQVTINRTHVFFGNVYDNRAYLLNWETGDFAEIDGNLVIRRYSR